MAAVPRSREISGPPSGTRVQALAEVPGLGELYLRGAAGSARSRLPGGRRGVGGRPVLPSVAYRASDVRVDVAHLTAYQHLLHETGADALPSGYLHVLAFPVATAVMVRDDFPLPLLGMVHVANAASLLRPVSVGDELEVTAWTQDLRPHRRGSQLDVVAEVSVDGEVAWRGVSTYLAKHAVAHPSSDGEEVGGTDPNADAVGGTDRSAEVGASTGDRAFQGSTSSAAPYLGESSDGDGTRDGSGEGPGSEPVGSVVWKLPAGVGREYGAVSGDRNPIHMSALSAKAFGFPRAIAHGMYTAARALADVGPRRGQTYDWTVEFAKPVLLPGTVAVEIAEPQRGSFEYTARHPRSGKTHLTGTVTKI